MSIVEKIKGHPFALWALALYLCSLGFNLKYDIPLVIFALSVSYLCVFMVATNSAIVKRHWHVIVFIAITIFLTLVSTDATYSAVAQVQFLPSILIYMALVTAIKSPKDLRFVYIVIVFITTVLSVTLIWQLAATEGTDMMIKLKESQSPLFIVPNDVLFLVVLSPVALAMAASEKQWALRMLAFLCLFCVGVVSIYIESRQAVAIYAVCFFIFFFLRKPLWGVLIGLAVTVLAFGVDALLGGGLVKKLFMFPRAYIWHSAWKMFLDSPIVGKGPGHFKHYYFEFLTKAGYGPELVPDRRLMNWAHSLYFEQLAERGIIGMAALLILVSRPLWGLGLRLRNHDINAGQGYRIFVAQHPYMTGLLVGYISLLLSGIAEASLLRLWTVTALFLLTGLACIEVFGTKN